MRPVGTIIGPQGSAQNHIVVTLLRYLLYETLTEVVPGPNQTLDPPCSDAEIFPWVIKEHVSC